MKINLNTKLTIPNNLQEITLEKYLRILDCLVEENEIVRDFKMISIWCDISLDDVRKIPATEFKEIVSIIITTLNQKFNLRPIIEIDGKEYGFIPNLEQMTSGEYIDLSNYFDTDFLRSMAVMYRSIKTRKKHLYTIDEYNGTDNYRDFLKCKASDYVGAKVFFYNLTNDLLKVTPKYLADNLTEEEKIKMAEAGVGIPQFTKLVEETDFDLTKL